jgi:hypothetical protein
MTAFANFPYEVVETSGESALAVWALSYRDVIRNPLSVVLVSVSCLQLGRSFMAPMTSSWRDHAMRITSS